LIASRLSIKHPSIKNKEKLTKKLPKHLENYLIEGNLESNTVLDSETDFKINMYLPIIDKINVELNKRFPINKNLLMGISAFDPKNN